MAAHPSRRLPQLADLVGGVRFDDPYRWLEDDGPEVRRWQAGLDAEACAHLAGMADLRAVTAAVGRHLSASALRAPMRRQGRWFDGDGRLVMVSEAAGEPGRVLVRAEALAAAAPATIDWFSPSPDGAWVAVGAASNGDEQSVLHLVRVDSGQVAAPRVPHASGGSVAWLPSSKGLYCLAGPLPDTHSLRKELVLIEPETAPHRIPLPAGTSSLRHVIQMSPDGGHVALVAHPAAPRLTHLFDRAATAWREVRPIDEDATLCGAFRDGRYFAVTTAGADRGRLVSSRLAELSSGRCWREVVPECDDMLRTVTPVGDLLLLGYLRAGASILRLVADDGTAVGAVPLPGEGLASRSGRAPASYGAASPVEADAHGCTFVFSTTRESPVLARFDLASRHTRVCGRPAISLRSLRTELLTCPAPDGTAVRYELMWMGGGDGPRPTLVAAYGGWNAVSAAKGYPAQFAPFLQAGGGVAFAHVRGDATFGAEQWRQGRRRLKQRSVDDACAVADDLVARGRADPDRLGIWGASNGALLVGAAIVQRPALFRVAIALVPLFDMCRFVRERFGEHATWEYGDPRDVDDAVAIRRYSPYHNVRTGARYPATLVVCGGADVRTPPWHGRKMVAALRSATVGRAPILLRVHEDLGHVTASELAPATVVGEWLAFAMHELDLPARTIG